MQVWGHTLFRNDERWLWFAVTSVINHLDKLLLWDTGSSDKSWEIALALKKKYGEKIHLEKYGEVSIEGFPIVRQAMLDETKSDWFLVVDADEIWWDKSISEVTSFIRNSKNNNSESIVVPTINAVGDIFHHQEKSAGKYKFGNLKGHYNLRALKRSIPGLHSEGVHGVWGWADDKGKQIQDRLSFKYLNSPYLHATFLPRGGNRASDILVPKRKRKLKYELGVDFPKDFYYPESLFKVRPDFIRSPWETRSNKYFIRAIIESPIKSIKRRIINGSIGY